MSRSRCSVASRSGGPLWSSPFPHIGPEGKSRALLKVSLLLGVTVAGPRAVSEGGA